MKINNGDKPIPTYIKLVQAFESAVFELGKLEGEEYPSDARCRSIDGKARAARKALEGYISALLTPV